MKYTKNITNKLKLLGFNFDYNNDGNGDDTNLRYEVWRKGIIDVTIEHSPDPRVIFMLSECDRDLKIRNINELSLIDKILNRS